ncbi:MAG: hypothetical protein GX078_00765, partial [Clostridiales bacterium]|nr:hypothetical protein [Clostridiales bacterium]
GAVEVSNNNVTLTTASTEGICFYPVGSTAEITVKGNTVGPVTGDNVHIKVNEKPLSVNGANSELDMLAAITADNNEATAKLGWFSTVAVIREMQYDSLEAAINAAANGDTINIIGNCTLTGASTKDKNLTFIGNNSKPKVTFPQKGYQTYYGCEFTFENLTLECAPDENYQGIQPDKVIARNCMINGKFWGYAKDLEFTDCIFNQETSYNIWTYGSNVTFENCEFNSAGRSVLIYNEGATLAVPAEIIFKNCTFSASSSVDRKAAIDIDTRFGSFNVKIENCSASGFSNETEEGGTVISEGFVHLKATDKGELTVSIDDKLVYPTVLNATQNKGYNTIQAAVTAAQEGDTILIAAGTYDLTSTLTINKSITVQGIDKEEVILKGANSITNTIYLGNGATLKNVTVTRDNSGDWATNKNNQLINFYNSNGNTTTLEECIITGGRNGVYVNTKTDIVIKDNLIDNNRTGIQMANRNDATVENNIITNNHTMGVLLLEFESVGTGKPIFTGNEIRDNWYSDFENRWAAEYVVDLTNNTFTDGTYKVADTSGEPEYVELHPVELGGTATRPEDRTTFIMKTEGNLILPSLD